MTDLEVLSFIEGIRHGIHDRALLMRFLSENGGQYDNVVGWLQDETDIEIYGCDNCGEVEFEDNIHSVEDGANYYCHDCYHAHCLYCDECEFDYDDRHNHEHSDDPEPSWGADHPGVGPFSSQPTILHQYSTLVAEYTGTFMTDKQRLLYNQSRLTDKELDLLFLGVELEVEPLATAPADVAKFILEDLTPWCILKKDSSLSSRGFEICSGPATLEWHLGGDHPDAVKPVSQWDRFFVNRAHLIASNPPSAGMHVHLSASHFTHLTRGRIYMMIHGLENRKFISAIAGRTVDETQTYTKSINDAKITDALSKKMHSSNCAWNPKNRRNFNSAIQFIETDEKGDLKRDEFGRKIIKKKTSVGQLTRRKCHCADGRYNGDRHEAINFNTQKPTFEIRIFASTNDQGIFLGRLEFCAALAEFCMEDRGIRNVHYNDFLGWIDKNNRKRFKHLSRYLVSLGYLEPRKTSKLIGV